MKFNQISDAWKYAFISNFTKKFSRFFSRDVALFVACQFALESDFGRSDLARYHNNFCGMKKPHIRISYAIKNSSDFAYYNTSDECISDYLLWCTFNRIKSIHRNELSSFKKFLVDFHYCDDKDYISRISALYIQFSIHLNFKCYVRQISTR